MAKKSILSAIPLLLEGGESVSYTHLFLWGKIPASCKAVEELTEKVLHQARVFLTPGFIFGSNGARFIRISLCCKYAKLAEALELSLIHICRNKPAPASI